MPAEIPQARVYFVLSRVGKLADSTTDEATAKHRAEGIGGLVVPLVASHDFRPTAGRPDRPPVNAQPFRPVPDPT